MVKIPLNSRRKSWARYTGKFYAIVDDSDSEISDVCYWYCVHGDIKPYAWGVVSGRQISMHRFLLGVNHGIEIDHVNGNGLDNRRANLRMATRAENMRNVTKRRGFYSSLYKGVSWSKAARKWEAHIKFNYKKIYLGLFANENDAAIAYDLKAKELFGRFARPNFT